MPTRPPCHCDDLRLHIRCDASASGFCRLHWEPDLRAF
jgi:hypothetical protein